MQKALTILLASVLAILAAPTSSHAAPPFDGLWATSRKDCRDKDGPDSKTFIDLDNVIKGKPAPLVVNMKIIAGSIARRRSATAWS